MLNNIFTKKANSPSPISITSIKTESTEVNDTDLLEFLVVQEATIGLAKCEHVRYTHLGEKEDCTEIITESASDFFNKMAEFFKNLLQKIKEFFGKLFLLIQSLMGKTKDLIENNKNHLLKKQSSFTVENYNYTIRDSSPNLKTLDSLVSTYNKEYGSITSMKLNEIKERRETFMESLPKLRGEILGSGTRIDDGELRETADAFFRDGDDSTQTIVVDNAYISKICSSYSQLDKTYNDCVKEKRKLEIQLEGLKKFFETGARQVKYVDGDKRTNINQLDLKSVGTVKSGEPSQVTANASNLKLINAYFDYRFAESKEISNIILTVIDAKTRALRDQVKHYNECIRKWIYAQPESRKDDK